MDAWSSITGKTQLVTEAKLLDAVGDFRIVECFPVQPLTLFARNTKVRLNVKLYLGVTLSVSPRSCVRGGCVCVCGFGFVGGCVSRSSRDAGA